MLVIPKWGARTSCQTPADEPKRGVSGKPSTVRMDGEAVRKMIVHPQYLHQASRDQREYGWSKLDMELCFSWREQGTWGLS
jgi:hypothetical protein